MSVSEIIFDNVVRGLVLDVKGKWVPLAEMMEIEYNVLKHLEAGQVLYNGQWVSIQKCKEIQAVGQMQSSGGNVPSSDADHISQKKPDSWVVVSCNSGEQQIARDDYLSLIRQATSEENTLEGEK
jgi:hypothetical protein